MCIRDRHERVLVTTLTKKMAEDLTDYLTEQGIKVKYMHHEVDTFERMEIIKDPVSYTHLFHCPPYCLRQQGSTRRIILGKTSGPAVNPI